jgi:hypothetical protein
MAISGFPSSGADYPPSVADYCGGRAGLYVHSELSDFSRELGKIVKYRLVTSWRVHVKRCRNSSIFFNSEAFLQAISKPFTAEWPIFRVLRKGALDLKPYDGPNPEKSATAKSYSNWALRYRLSKSLTIALGSQPSGFFQCDEIL